MKFKQIAENGVYRYRVDVVLKSGVVAWRSAVKGCKASLKIDNAAKHVLTEKHEHNHELEERKNEAIFGEQLTSR